MTAPRFGHRATLLPSGKVLVTGGREGFSGIAEAELYDPNTRTWSPTGSMSSPRLGHTMTLLATGKVLVAGGVGELGSPIERSAELYDPDTGQWTPTGSMSTPRSGHTATLLSTGNVLVVSGEGPPFSSAELYNPATGEWHATGSLSTGRTGHTATLLASGQVLVLGGGPGPTFVTSSAELYDPAAGTWTPAAPMLVARGGHTATLLRSGDVLVAGGGGAGPSSNVPMDAELYDPAAGTSHRTGSLGAAYSGHTATRLPSGRVLVVGAFGAFDAIPNTQLFDPESETWSDAGCLVEARIEHTATLLPSGAVLVAGGFNLSNQKYGLGSAELYGIIVSPPRVSLTPGTSQTFTARGGSGFDYVWSFKQNNSGGTLTAAGLYQAGQVGGVTDVLQVVDSFANSATATVNVTPQPSTVSATSAHANPGGCSTTNAAALPALGGLILVLLGRRPLSA
jgi:hypothetical protein